MEYKIGVGASVKTTDIDKQIKDYKGNINVGVNPQSVTSGIDAALKGYKATPINVGATLITKGITDKITLLNKEANRKNIKIGIDPVFDGIEGIIKDKTFNTPLRVNVELNWSGVAKQIANPNFGTGEIPKFKLDVELDDNAFLAALERYKKSDKSKVVPFQVKPIMSTNAWDEVEATLEGYTAKNKLKVNLDLSKTEINRKITEYNQTLSQDNGRKILLGAELKANAITDAIANFKSKNTKELSIPIDLTINNAENIELDSKIKERIKEYQSSPIWIPVKLKPAEKGFASQISKLPVFVEAKLKNADDINKVISGYADNVVPVAAKLVPAAKGFTSEVTKTPIQIQAELAPDAINKAIANPPKNLSKIPIGVTLTPKDANDINNQVKQLSPLLSEKLNVGVDLNETSVNSAIALFKPTATLGVDVSLNIENVDEQIRTYNPKEQIKVNVLFDDNNIDPTTGNQIKREPIVVDVKLNRDGINDQINKIKPSAKVKVGVKLDFASHKDENGKEIQKGVSKQLKEYDAKTKIKVGIQLDDSDVSSQIQGIDTGAPVKLGVELDKDSVIKQVEEIRQQLQSLGNITVHFGSDVVDAAESIAKTGNSNSDAANAAQRVIKQTQKLVSDDAEKSIKRVTSKGIGKYFRISKSSSEAFESEMENLVNTWTKGKGSLVGVKISTKTSWDEDAQRNVERLHQAQVEYNDELGVTQKRTVAWRQIGVKTIKGQQEAVYGFAEVSANYSKSIDKTQSKADKFAKQQRRAASDLTNQINQVHRDALDQNANRPIKEQANLTALSNKYKEITDAIKSMGMASSDTFDEEQNRVKQLISEYKSMKSEFKNAENVANKMTGTDYQSGRSIAEQNLAEFKAKAKEYPQIAKTINELDNAFNKVGDASSLKEFNNQLRVAKAELAKVKAEANIAKMGEKLGIDSSNLKNDIDDLKRANPELVNFKTNINGVEVSVESLLNDLSQVKTKADFDSVNSKFRQFAEAAKNAGVALNDTTVKAKTISDIKNKLADTGFNGFSQEIKRAHTDVEAMSASMGKLGISSDVLQTALNGVDVAFDKINAAEEVGDMKALQLANKEYEESLERLTSLMLLFKQAKDTAFDSEKLELDKADAILELDNIFEEGSQAAKRFGDRMQELKNKIHDCAADSDMKIINKEISIFNKDVKKSGLRTKTFATSVKEQFQRYSQYLSVSSALMYAGQALRSMFEQVKLIDAAMTELKKVTDETDESYNQFLSRAATRSKELGTTVDGLISSTADFARLGYSFEQSQGLAEVANIYAVVGDEIEGVEDATQSLVSTLAAFKHEMGSLDESEFALSIVDKMNEVSNNFAISSGGIGAALQRSASSMAAANNSLDETIALITAANTVVQNPEKVGNGFKTMSMRIRGAKTELEEAGESTEGMAESTASLREEILALSGVDIMLDKDTFKSTYDIMDELSQKWEGLSDIAQATITELVAGKHQGNVMSSLMANFDIARDALNTSINSSGSALAEHAKWSESLEARLNKLKAAWQSLSQTFMKSDFLKIGLDIVTGFIDVLDKIIDKTGIIMPLLVGFAGKKIFSKIFNTAKVMQFDGGMSSVADVIAVLSNAFPKLSGVISAFTSTLATSGSVLGAFGAALGAINPIILGVTAAIAAIGIGVSWYNKTHESAEELAERIEEVTTKYKDQHSELSKLKEDYDTSNEESMISRYGELSKGVNEFGENLALTTDEYAEYQSIVEQMVSTNPELIAGYNSQGDAILKYAGNVDKLSESYRDLIKEQNNELLTGKDEDGKFKDKFSNAKDILRDFNNDLNDEFDGITHKGAVSGMNWLEDILAKGALSDKEIEDAVNSLSGAQAMEISRLIEENGIKRDVLGSGDWGYETFQEHVIRAVKENKSEIKNTVKDVRSNVDSYAEDLGTVTSAYFNQAFLGGDDDFDIKNYSSEISDRMQSILEQTASNLDGLSYIDIIGDASTNDEKWQALKDFYDSTLNKFATMSKSDAAKFEAAFDLETQFNGGEISFGEYVDGLQDAEELIYRLGVHGEVEKQIKLSLGLSDADGDGDWSLEQYDNMLKRLTSGSYGIQMEDAQAESLLRNLTASEYAVAVRLIMSDDVDLSNFNINTLRSHIEREAKISEALTFNTSISVDTAALETFNTALSESASAVGLTSESISALESKYKDLNGYDSAKLFEATTNGVKVNREEVAKLEKQYQDLQKSKTKKHLETLVNEYNRLTSEIDKTSNAAERANLLAQRNGYLSQIEALAQYQAQLEGVTGAYQRWIDAQNTSEDYEGYEAVAKGWETVKDEISRGLLGNASKEYIDLLSGKDLRGANIDAYAEAWDKLDDKVTSTGYSVKDFFTLDDDGNITATGIHRFFESVKEDFDGIYDASKDTYNFTEDNLNDIQEKYGLGIEAIGLLLEGASSAGYNVDWAGILDGLDLATSDFETLLEYAEAAQDAFNKLDFEDVDFNFKTDNVEDATTQLENAKSIYQDLITDNNGNINLKAKGAEQMRVMLSTLLVQKQQLEDSSIAINVNTSGLDESQQDIANAINAVKDFREKYKNLEIAVTTGQGIDEAKTALGDALIELQGLGDEGVDIAANLILGEGSNGDALKGEIDAALALVGENNKIPVGFKLDETSLGTLNSQLLTNFTKDAVVKWTNDGSEVDTYASTEKEAGGKVKWSNDDSLVIEFQNTNHSASGTVYWDDNTVNLKTTYTGKGIVYWDTEANGTANVNGTTSGRAFAHGDWRIKGSGTALGGELGMETLVRDGHFYTIGDNGAEFFKYKQGDIIFNHKQTEELFKNGKVTSGGGHGRMFVNGSAFANGSYPSSGKAFVNPNVSASATTSKFAYARVYDLASKDVEIVEVGESDFSNKNKPQLPNKDVGNKSEVKSEAESDFEETIDWIETAIDRIERAIDKLDQKANSVYRAWSERNTALADQIGKVGEEIELQQQAYNRYLQEADSIGLSEEYASKVRDGTIDIEKITDEELKKKIDEYKQWYEKAITCKDAIEELKETESELYAQRFENVQTQYDGILQGYEHTEAMLNEYISQAEERGHIVSKKYYQALIDNEKDNIDELRREQSDLIAERDNAVASGAIIEGSEAWLEQCAAIDEVTQAIEESTTSLLEFDNAMREIDWEIFDLIQERISGVSEEAEFLIELMSNKKLFDDDGKLTSQGLATMGLHAQNYNSHMYQADAYGEEVSNLNAQIAKDPYDQELINRRNELLELQRESILAAEDEKNSIRDMVEEGINLELDALQERIDKYNESIDAAKDLYDYQKNVKEQSEEIASLEKQRAAYLGNDSEEGKAKLQEIEVSLKEAKENLQETEYDKYISDQQALLDTLYNEYELILNQRLDNVDYLLEQVIESINIAASADGIIATALGNEGALAIAIGNNATSIKSTLESESKNVGIALSSAMNSIWSTGEGNAKSVLTMYGEDFRTKSTTIITTLNGIKTSVNSMVASLNKETATKTSANKTSTSAKKYPTKSSATTKTATTKKSNGGDGVPKVGDKVKFVSGQYYYDSQGKKPLGSQNQGKYVYITKVNKENWATHPYHIATDKDGKHPLGWLKLNQLSGYAAGKQNFLDDEIAWTQENWENNGREFIIRPSDGAILTPIAKGDSVLTSVASKNIWNMANSPADFIKDNLNLGSANVPSSNVQNSYVQHFENVTFSMPNVHGYDELLKEMQRDPKFEKLILSMSIDRIAGKSSLAKGKSIR